MRGKKGDYTGPELGKGAQTGAYTKDKDGTNPVPHQSKLNKNETKLTVG